MSKPEVFVRSKSGLVRVMGTFDAFVLNVIVLSFFTGVIYSFQLVPTVLPGANMGIAFLLTIVFTSGLYVSYAFMSSSYPRAGGDYVYQSRLIHPALAFVATFSAWVVYQWFYNASFAVEAIWQSIQSLLGLYGWLYNSQGLVSAASWTVSPTGMLLVGGLILFVSTVCAMMKLSFIVKLQLVFFALSCIGLLGVYFALLTTTPQSFAANFNSMMTWSTGNSTDWYSKVISDASAAGYTPQGFDWYQTLAAVPIAMIAMGYAFWSIYLAGEIKTARVTRLALYAIYGCVIFMGIVFFLVYELLLNVGSLFYNSLFYLYLTGGAIISQIPITPNYISVAMIATSNPALIAIIAIGTFANVFILMVIMPIVGSRVMFAQAMDWVLPQKIAQIGKRFVAPVWAIWVYFIGSLIWFVADIYYPSVAFYFTAVVVGVLLAYLLTGVSAIVFPYRQKAAYESSPISKYKIGNIPASVIAGIGTLALCVYILWFYLTIPGLGLLPISISNPSLDFVVGLYVILLVWYYAVKWYRSRKGIDLNLSFKVVPPE
jgi:amino acid transporter